jgi:predicted Zn-dependent protease
LANEKISVFEYDSEARLTRVLSHELGHALGLEHVEDPDAIMYKLNKSKNSIPTESDMAAVAALCTTWFQR